MSINKRSPAKAAISPKNLLRKYITKAISNIGRDISWWIFITINNTAVPTVVTLNLKIYLTDHAEEPINVDSRGELGHYQTIISLSTFHRRNALGRVPLYRARDEILLEKMIQTSRQRPLNFGHTMKRHWNTYRIQAHLLSNPTMSKVAEDIEQRSVQSEWHATLHGELTSNKRNILAPALLERTARTVSQPWWRTWESPE